MERADDTAAWETTVTGQGSKLCKHSKRFRSLRLKFFYDSYTYFINKLLFPVSFSIQQLCLVLVNFIYVFHNSI